MPPDFGLSKGREVSLWSVAQASSLISALRVVLSAVGVVGAEEVGVADEEALLVVVGVDEPAGDPLVAIVGSSPRATPTDRGGLVRRLTK